MATPKELNEDLDAIKRALAKHELTEPELAQLAARVTHLKELVEKRKTHSILELQGLGKDYWRSIDVEKYLRKERESWD